MKIEELCWDIKKGTFNVLNLFILWEMEILHCLWLWVEFITLNLCPRHDSHLFFFRLWWMKIVLANLFSQINGKSFIISESSMSLNMKKMRRDKRVDRVNWVSEFLIWFSSIHRTAQNEVEKKINVNNSIFNFIANFGSSLYIFILYTSPLLLVVMPITFFLLSVFMDFSLPNINIMSERGEKEKSYNFCCDTASMIRKSMRSELFVFVITNQKVYFVSQRIWKFPSKTGKEKKNQIKSENFPLSWIWSEIDLW